MSSTDVGVEVTPQQITLQVFTAEDAAVELYNPNHELAVVFRVLSDCAARYVVSPRQGVLKPQERIAVSIALQHGVSRQIGYDQLESSCTSAVGSCLSSSMG